VRPWSIEVNRNPNTQGWFVGLDHEASNGLGFDLGHLDATATIEAFDDALRHSAKELARVAAAPALVHPDEVLEIRTLAHIFNWSRQEVSAVVRFVERWMLTSDEADWLIKWVGHDGEMPSPSQDF
jgi:hypothetical protein